MDYKIYPKYTQNKYKSIKVIMLEPRDLRDD